MCILFQETLISILFFQTCVGSAGQNVTTIRITEADFCQFPDDHTNRQRDDCRFKIHDLVAV